MYSTNGKSTTNVNDKPGTPASGMFTYAELFAGIGGFGVALDALGGKCVFVSELEDHIREQYCHAFQNTEREHCHGDICKVKDNELPRPFSSSPKIDGLDLLVAGFPCQPFSSLGQQPGFADSKGKGHLYLEIVRVLNISQPRAFLLENVQGLLSMSDTYQTILAAFEEAGPWGYQVTTEVCTARGLTATTRKRLFFVGLRKDLVITADNGTEEQFLFPYVPDLKLRAQHVLDYDTLTNEELDILRLQDETMEQPLSNGRWRPKKLAWPNNSCNTLTSHYGNAVGRGESQLVPGKAPAHPRRFSVREMARLMGFPNTYRILPQRKNQLDMAYRKDYYRMFGNAVCPPVIAALAGAVLASSLKNREDCVERCDEGDKTPVDWVRKGQDTAVFLAKMAMRPGGPVDVPAGSIPTIRGKGKNRI